MIKQAQVALTPTLFALARFSIAALPFLPILNRLWGDRASLWAGFELGMWGGLAYLCQAQSVVTIPGGRASLISTFTVKRFDP